MTSKRTATLTLEASRTWSNELTQVLLGIAGLSEAKRKDGANFSAHVSVDSDFQACQPAELFPAWSDGCWELAVGRLAKHQKLTAPMHIEIAKLANEHGDGRFPVMSLWRGSGKRLSGAGSSRHTFAILQRAQMLLPREVNPLGGTEDVFTVASRDFSMSATQFSESAAMLPLVVSRHAFLRFVERRGGFGARSLAACLLPAMLASPLAPLVCPEEDAEFVLPSPGVEGGAFIARVLPLARKWLPLDVGPGMRPRHAPKVGPVGMDHMWRRASNRRGHGYHQTRSPVAYGDLAGTAVLDIRTYYTGGMLVQAGLERTMNAAKAVIGTRKSELEDLFFYLYGGAYLGEALCEGTPKAAVPALLTGDMVDAINEVASACRIPSTVARKSRPAMHGLSLLPERKHADVKGQHEQEVVDQVQRA